MKKLVVGDAIKLAIKTVGGSYGTLAPFVRLPDPQWLPPAESQRDHTCKKTLHKAFQVANFGKTVILYQMTNDRHKCIFLG